MWTPPPPPRATLTMFWRFDISNYVETYQTVPKFRQHRFRYIQQHAATHMLKHWHRYIETSAQIFFRKTRLLATMNKLFRFLWPVWLVLTHGNVKSGRIPFLAPSTNLVNFFLLTCWETRSYRTEKKIMALMSESYLSFGSSPDFV